ncbi:hypothetical protein K493DRAFT_318045 [Basidiobolus meristosporus CBS 931.73]|uniref:Uncharacterized protein n=1 Tax=Basidiobolus meristosporus CBS 931.73 TaxID=1314790 RepID=A0A1Y1XYA6_9FUNG|nr:hypothetical protein K493DRAFT_318045 [Basidiobolus meristosporus CBS 931.73]|eukprot:ORX90344.1 hypothetical protein K493DRAFT_318045 [Basidiobolus meristosporus CBS 931.73]
MLPLISISSDRFPKQHSQAFAGLRSIIEYNHVNDPKIAIPKSSLTLSRFQDLSNALEENQGTFELVHGLNSFAQSLEQETVSVRKALLYLKRMPLPEFSEELCRHSDQIYPRLAKQELPMCRYNSVDRLSEGQEPNSLDVVLNEISQDKVSWQYNQMLDYITRLISEVSSKKSMLETTVHEIDRLTTQITSKSKKIEVITMKALGQKAIHLFQDHHGLLRDLGEAIRKIETTYSVHFHPYVILQVFISAIQYRQQQIASFLLDENYNWIEKMASDIEVTVQTAISLAHQIMQQHDKLMSWRRKLLDLYLDKKRQICRVKSDNRYLLDKSRLLEHKKTLTHKSFTKLKELTSETAHTAQQFLTRVRCLFHQIDEKLSEANNIDHRERDLLTQLITSSFNVPASDTKSTEQSIVPKKNAHDQLEFNSRASASHIHSFELQHQSELERLLYLIQVLDSQGKVLVMVNEIFSSWVQPLGNYTDAKP